MSRKPPKRGLPTRSATRPAADDQAPRAAAESLPPLERLMGGLLAGGIAVLQVGVPLVPSESAVHGPGVLFAQLWLLLLVLGLVLLLARRRPLDIGPVDIVTLALGGWLLISASVRAWDGNPRATWSTTWQWIGLLAGFWLVRQCLRGGAARRALLAVLIGLAVGLAGHGIYQFTVSLPQQRQQYRSASEEQKQEILRASGVDHSPKSPERRNFENRLLGSTEPFASFSLANSLAGVLAPWTIFVLAVAIFPASRAFFTGWRRVAMVLMIGGLVYCLLLTKSRVAWLALVAGAVALDYSLLRARGWRGLKWTIVALVGLLLTLVLAGIVDRRILTEAGVSVAYRLQYWQAALAMTADYPLLGCGPGNFQDYYARYKLPMASETVADPHNLVLEAAANGGLVAGLLLVGLIVAVTLRLARRGMAVDTSAPNPPDGTAETPRGHLETPTALTGVGPIYVGALLGVFIASTLAWSSGFPPEMLPGTELPVAWVLTLPLLAATLLVLDPWVRRGTLREAEVLAGWVAIVLNLTAAGGISYPGVGQSFWILAALGVAAPAVLRTSDASRGVWSWYAALLVAVGLAFGCWISATQPTRAASQWMVEAAEARNFDQAERMYSLAAEADPWDPLPWQWLAEMHQLQWLQTRQPRLRESFARALAEARRRDARSYSFAMREGELWLRAYRSTGEAASLAEAHQAYRRACELYPNSNFAHAQLAWSLALAGELREARQSAERALALDKQNPHTEQKLAERVLHDPARDMETPAAGPPPPSGSAEQVMQELRTAKMIPE